MKSKLFFRADGNQKIGLGHVYRSLALAEMLKTDFDCHFIIRNPLPALQQTILQTCKSLIKLPETHRPLEEARTHILPILQGEEILVLDGYGFDTDYQTILKEKGNRIVCIDDIHATHFVADVVINHAGGISPAVYSRAPYTRLCTGPDYALLRSPFCEAAQNRKEANERHCFVCLGGADPHNDTLKVLRQLERSGHIECCYVVTGAAYGFLRELNSYMQQTKMRLYNLSNLDAESMVKVMQKCGTAVCPPSSIAYEYLSVGGTLYLHQIADNQTQISNYLLGEGLAFPFAEFPIQAIEARKKAKALQAQIFRGDSPQHFFHLFKNLNNAIYQSSC